MPWQLQGRLHAIRGISTTQIHPTSHPLLRVMPNQDAAWQGIWGHHRNHQLQEQRVPTVLCTPAQALP